LPIVKVVSVPIKVTGKDDAELKIGQVGVAAEKLSRLNPTITVQIEKTRALLEARLLRAGIQAELSKVTETVGVERRGGILGRVLGGASSGAAGGSGFLGTITGALGGLASAGPAGIAVLAGLAAAAAALATALGGAIAAIAAAGIGFAAFGALAGPTLAKVVGGIASVSSAATAVARDKAWDAIPKAMQPVVQGALNLKNAFSGAAHGIQPLVLTLLSDALKAAKPLLTALIPIAKTSGQAIDGLLKGFAQFAQSSGFRQFMAQMQTLAGPGLTAIGKGVGSVVVAIGKLLQQMANPTGVATLTALFKILAGTVGLIGLAFEGLNKTLLPFVSHSLGAAAAIVTAFKFVTDAVLGSLKAIVDGTAKAFGWLPGGIGKSLKATADQFDRFKTGVDSSLSGARSALSRWSLDVANAPKIFALKANITDLQNKLATARALLADPHLTATRRARVEANIDQLQAQIRAARAALDALQGKTVQTFIQGVLVGPGSAGGPVPRIHMASGGFVGGAQGSQLVMVGEMGRELVGLPRGSYVYPHAATERMMAGGATNVTYNINVQVGHGTNPKQAAKEIADILNQGATSGVRIRKSILATYG
jgi:hypothetical protein